MKLVRSKIIFLMLGLIMACSMFTGCSKDVDNVWLVDEKEPTSATKGNNGDMYLDKTTFNIYQKVNDNWILMGNIKGAKGDTGKDGKDGKDGVTPTIEISKNGYWIINGKETNTRAEGRDGKDGISPLISISEEGYWVINGIKTAVKAKAQDGTNGKDGIDGKDGKDGVTPTIEFSEDGYWVINGVKTKIKAKGEDGITPTIEISEDGYWVINGVKTKIRAMYIKTLNGLCTYLDNGVAEKTVGAKYSCDFGAGARNFYILELGTNPASNTTLKSDEVALILEGNYDTTTQAWCDQNGANPSNNVCAADGLTAKLDEIASAWTILERAQIVLPSMEQIMLANGKAEDAYTNGTSLSNVWLYNWPDNANYGKTAPYGYWSSSSANGNSSDAFYVTYSGLVYSRGVYLMELGGVRPVINLKI